MWLIRQALKLRQERQLFAPEHSYRAVVPRGAKSAHVIAFLRGERAVTVVPRWPLKRAGNWGDTVIELPQGQLAKCVNRRARRRRRNSTG